MSGARRAPVILVAAVMFGLVQAKHLDAAGILFGLVDTGELFVSTDNGMDWMLHSDLPVRDAVALQARSNASDLFIATRSGVVYRSTNGGVDWTAVGAVSESGVVDLLIRSDGVLLLLTDRGTLYHSVDQGASFIPLAFLTASNFTSLTGTSGDQLYALTRTGEVYESLDQGATWDLKGGLTASNTVRMRALSATLYGLTDTGDVYRSTNAGANWTVIGTLSQVGMRGLAANGPDLAAASREGHLATSPDGVTWTWQGSINQLTLTALATDIPATTGIEEAPEALRIASLWPNPARRGDRITVDFTLGGPAPVELTLYDVVGREVWARQPEVLPAGGHSFDIGAPLRRSGVYFLELSGSRLGSVSRRLVITN